MQKSWIVRVPLFLLSLMMVIAFFLPIGTFKGYYADLLKSTPSDEMHDDFAVTAGELREGLSVKLYAKGYLHHGDVPGSIPLILLGGLSLLMVFMALMNRPTLLFILNVPCFFIFRRFREFLTQKAEEFSIYYGDCVQWTPIYDYYLYVCAAVAVLAIVLWIVKSVLKRRMRKTIALS